MVLIYYDSTCKLTHCLCFFPLGKYLKTTHRQAILSQSSVPCKSFGLCLTSKKDPLKSFKQIHIRFITCKLSCHTSQIIINPKGAFMTGFTFLVTQKIFLQHKKYSCNHQKNSHSLPSKNASRRHSFSCQFHLKFFYR